MIPVIKLSFKLNQDKRIPKLNTTPKINCGQYVNLFANGYSKTIKIIDKLKNIVFTVKLG